MVEGNLSALQETAWERSFALPPIAHLFRNLSHQCESRPTVRGYLSPHARYYGTNRLEGCSIDRLSWRGVSVTLQPKAATDGMWQQASTTSWVEGENP